MPRSVQIASGVTEELARHGLRATRQRLAVLKLLRSADNHPSVPELHRKLLRLQPNVSRKTVYEIVDSLVRVGLASVVTEGGEPYRYESNNAPHYHARCRVCDRIFDLPPRSWKPGSTRVMSDARAFGRSVAA